MRKNGSKLISIKQYRLGDLFVFTLIAAIAELVCYYSRFWFPGAAYYTLNLMLPVITLVMVRWGWPGIILAVAEGALGCAIRGSGWESYIIFMVSNAAIAIELLVLKLIGAERLQKRWYWAFLVVLSGWVAVNFTRTCIYAAFYGDFLVSLATWFGLFEGGLLALVMGELIILICRRLDGMFENQKRYLLRLKKERDEEQRLREEGEAPVELDEESLSILNRKYDGLD